MCWPAGTTAAAGVVSQGDWTLGLSASALSGLSSAYAGVYFEKYVKGKMSSTLWIRNLQLGIYGLPLSIAYMYAKDHGNLRHGGIMQVGICLLLRPFAAQPPELESMLWPNSFCQQEVMPHAELS